MNRAITDFERFALLEKRKSSKKGLKALVNKDEDEEMTLDDAERIGRKVANMEGLDKKKYIGIINFLGASCQRYKKLWSAYKQVRDSKKKSEK